MGCVEIDNILAQPVSFSMWVSNALVAYYEEKA